MTEPPPSDRAELRRSLTLIWLVFYGVGVTVGAGIFALIGEVVGLVGDQAPLAFLLAGIVAAFTGFSYAILAGVYPRAAGEAVFVRNGFGRLAGAIVGYAVVAVAITSSATITIAFVGYLSALVNIPQTLSIVAVLGLLGLVAWLGVRESVGIASLITVIELAALAAVFVAGLPNVTMDAVQGALAIPATTGSIIAMSSGAFLAFFAFIGFEDIENMAEETVAPERTIPMAILLTLVVSTVFYMLVALVASAFPDRASLMASHAPLAFLFEQSGVSGAPIAAMAAVAMINGILVQIIMASRVLYGMGRDGLGPAVFAFVDPARQTPIVGIVVLVLAIAGLATTLPMVGLARTTSLVMLLVFTAVNFSLYAIGMRKSSPARLRRWRYLGLAGGFVSLGLAALDLTSIL